MASSGGLQICRNIAFFWSAGNWRTKLPKNSKLKVPRIPIEGSISWKDWLKGRRVRRESSRLRNGIRNFLCRRLGIRQFLEKTGFSFAPLVVNRSTGNATAGFWGAVCLHDGGAGFDFQRPGLGCHSFLHVGLTRNIQALDVCWKTWESLNFLGKNGGRDRGRTCTDCSTGS